MNISRRNFLWSSIAAVGALMMVKYGLSDRTARANMKKPSLSEPTGTANRVVSIHSEHATSWDSKAYPYVDYTNQQKVTDMLGTALITLTGKEKQPEAWQSLFSTYKKGDLVVIKPNFNDLYMGFNGIVTTPVVLNAILYGLVEVLKVPTSDIIIYDCTRQIGDELRSRISYPVNYVEPYGSNFFRKVWYHTIGNPYMANDLDNEITMSSDVRDKAGNPVKCYLPKVITEAAHIINVPVLKSHQYVSNSGALKNHYGTVRFSDHHTGPEYIHPPIIHDSIVDINAHEHIKHKTRLVVMDGLFGRLHKKDGGPVTWNTFGNSHPSTLLVSQDPVALDTVAMNIIKRELDARDDFVMPHDYLHKASDRGLGIHEDPESGLDFKKIDFKEIEAES